VCDTKLTLDNSVLTCIHVLNRSEKYEYIEQTSEAVESFTCSDCLDFTERDNEGVMKFLRLVCRKCFIESRVGIA